MIVAQHRHPKTGESVIKHKPYGADEWRTSHFSPYFYVDASEGYRLPDGVDGRVERDVEPRAYDGTPLHRVTVAETRDVRTARDAADNHYEADIPFERRYYIDRVDSGFSDAQPHVMHVDIEVDTRGGNPDAIEAAASVLSISGYSELWDSHLDFLLRPPLDAHADEHLLDPDVRDSAEALTDIGVPEEVARAHADTTTDDKGRECIYLDVDGRDEPLEVHVFDEEDAMLDSFASVMRKSGVEVVTGWNVEDFDMAYLISRMDRLPGCNPDDLSPLGNTYVSHWYNDNGNRNINANVAGVDVFDMYEAYQRQKRDNKPPNWKLDTVADHEGTDVGKIPFDTAKTGQIWAERPLWVMEYNHRDAILTHHIDEQMGTFDQFLTYHRELAVPFEDTTKNSVLVEMYVMARSPSWGVERRILDSKRTQTNDFEGGNTKQPNAGLYENVFSVDVTSEYPNWVRAANLSPETVVLEGDPEWDDPDVDLIDTPYVPEEGFDENGEPVGPDILPVKFLHHDERLGILPRAVDEMFHLKSSMTEQRDEHEPGGRQYEIYDGRRDTAKELLNSIQGVTGMETHRLSKNEVSASITALGRETVEYMKDVGEEWGYEFVYADTDSVFLRDPTRRMVENPVQAVDAAQSIAAEINDSMPRWAVDDYGVPERRAEHLEVEPDKVAKRAFFPNAKKRYTLWLFWKDGKRQDKISHTGWAIVRSDTSELEHRVQERALEALMHNRSESFVTRKLGEEMMKVVEGEYDPMQLARPQGSARAFESYGDNEGTLDFEGVDYFVAAMLSSNALLGTNYQGGDKAWMLPVEETETVEIDGSTNEVNYLAIDEDTELPDWVELDYKKLMKNIIGKVDRIYDSLDWDKGALYEKRDDALQQADVNQKQSVNHGLGAFTS